MFAQYAPALPLPGCPCIMGRPWPSPSPPSSRRATLPERVSTDPHEHARRAAAAMYAEDQASRALGIIIEDVAPGRATARMRVTAAMVNGHRIAHGGYIFLLADTAFAFACNTHAPTVAGAAEVVFIASVSEGEELVAEARERLRFGRNGIYDVTVRRAGGGVVA
jgi:acyl-CoA thioesterase